jgi:hypothetical protein
VDGSTRMKTKLFETPQGVPVDCVPILAYLIAFQY